MDVPVSLTFQRYEKKYLLNEKQLDGMKAGLGTRMTADPFRESTVCSLYYDTPNYDLIRASLDRPAYREKLRVRCYGVPSGEDGTAFVEIKKKLHGEVFKRRAAMTVSEAADYLSGRARPDSRQDLAEIDWFLRRYDGLAPRVFVACDREAFIGRDDPALRVTFDRNIRWRRSGLDLLAGDKGSTILEPGMFLMEVKLPSAAPLWLARLFSELELRPVTYSKYGTVYRENLLQPAFLFRRGAACPQNSVRLMPENGVFSHV